MPFARLSSDFDASFSIVARHIMSGRRTHGKLLFVHSNHDCRNLQGNRAGSASKMTRPLQRSRNPQLLVHLQDSSRDC